MYMRKETNFALCGVFPQDGAQEEQHSKTKQESAWLFRLWYTFDHKYPFATRLCNTESSVSHYFFMLAESEKCSSSCVSVRVPSSAIKAPVKRAVVGGGGVGGWGGGWGPETQIHETSLLTPVTTRCE